MHNNITPYKITDGNRTVTVLSDEKNLLITTDTYKQTMAFSISEEYLSQLDDDERTSLDNSLDNMEKNQILHS